MPILAFKDVDPAARSSSGSARCTRVFDDKGNAYTSVFLESKVAKWSLADLKLIEKMPVHYNIGHIVAAEGDTVSPDGKYVVAMNKWSIDRFADGRAAAPAELPARRHRAGPRCSCSPTCRSRSASRTTRR